MMLLGLFVLARLFAIIMAPPPAALHNTFYIIDYFETIHGLILFANR